MKITKRSKVKVWRKPEQKRRVKIVSYPPDFFTKSQRDKEDNACWKIRVTNKIPNTTIPLKAVFTDFEWKTITFLNNFTNERIHDVKT